LLAYGAVVLEEIIRRSNPKEIVMSALGVREGLLYQRLNQAERDQDPLLVAAQELNVLRSRAPNWRGTVRLDEPADETSHLDETKEEARLRHAACLLSDVGWRAHPDYRGEQSLNLIANAGLYRHRPSRAAPISLWPRPIAIFRATRMSGRICARSSRAPARRARISRRGDARRLYHLGGQCPAYCPASR